MTRLDALSSPSGVPDLQFETRRCLCFHFFDFRIKNVRKSTENLLQPDLEETRASCSINSYVTGKKNKPPKWYRERTSDLDNF